MFNSAKYWNQRYVNGGNSGAGSYNEFAHFKACVINNFIEKTQINSIIDYGVGDCNQLKLINTEKMTYTGIDVSEFIVSKCKEEYKYDDKKNFIHTDDMNNDLRAELVMSCDVIYHLIEYQIYKKYMDKLFSMSTKYVIIYAPNINYKEADHVLKREFIEYIFDNFTNFNLIDRVQGDCGCPFYIFQKSDTYTPGICKNILQVTKEAPIDIVHVNKINHILDGYDYHWFNDETMFNYIQTHQLEEFPDLIKHIKSLSKGQHKADIFRYYWLYLNGGVFIDSDLMIERNMDYKDSTFISVKSYHTNKDILFNGFIACSKFNPIIYKALKQSCSTSDLELRKDYHLFCAQFYTIYHELKANQSTYLLQERKEYGSTEYVKSFYNDTHILTHWCYGKKMIKDIFQPNPPIYISLTSIFANQSRLVQTLQSILKQSRLPDKIFLYLSEEPYILDDGFSNKKITNPSLLKLVTDTSIINVKWVKNTGSYRKLIPLLQEKWGEDCIIITIDDDTVYVNTLIDNLVSGYNEHKCVVGFRGFTPLFDNISNFDYHKRDKLQQLSLYNFLTGVGGILYTPDFFKKTKNLIFNEEVYLNTCDKQDDIWFYLVRVLNDIPCYIGTNKWLSQDISGKGLSINFNSINNNNTIALNNTIKRLVELDYQF